MSMDKLTLVGLILSLAVALLLPGEVLEARDIELLDMAQDQFDDFARDVGLAVSYAPADPARTRGIIGFDVGADVTFAQLESDDYMDKGFDGSAPGTLPLPRLRAAKGLPFGIDVSASYSADPGGNTQLLGASLKYGLTFGPFGRPMMPDMAVRASGTQLLGVSDLDLLTYGVDLSVSQEVGVPIPFTPSITPYAGVGIVQIEADPDDISLDGTDDLIDDYSSSEMKYFVGSEFSLPLLPSVVAEAEFSEIERYTLRANIGF